MGDPRPGFIYKLIDPRTDEARYVGKTGKSKTDRLRSHRVDAFRRGHSRLHRWLRKLYKAELEPRMDVLQECLPGMMDACEKEWIARGKAKGWRLVNATDGGERTTFEPHVKKKIAGISREAWTRPEYRQRNAAAMAAVWARKKGMTVEQHGEWKRQKREAGRRVHAEAMRIHAERVREAEDRKGWVRVPLTHGGAAYVHLTNGKRAVVDVGDWGRVNEYRWSCQSHRKGHRAKTNISQHPTLLNRFVAGVGDEWCVTFANGNQLDCRRVNLKIERRIRLWPAAA